MAEDLVEITFGLHEETVEDSKRQEFARRLLQQVRKLDEVESAERTEETEIEPGSKGFGTITGFLTAKVTWDSTKSFLGFLKERFEDKSLKLHLKVDGEEITLEAKSSQELEVVDQKAQEWYERMKQKRRLF